MARSVLGAIAALALCVIVLAGAFEAFPYQPGADFYQFWGVPVAKRLSGSGHTPYVDPAGYAATLNALSDASSSGKLHAANALRRTLEPMATPFLYAAFAIFPADYDAAHAIFVTLVYSSAALGVMALASLRGLGFRMALCAAFAMELTFAPFMLDVRAGNINSLQLALIAAWVLAAGRNASTGRPWGDALLLGILAPFVIFKPNTVWIAAALAVQFALARGRQELLRGIGVGVVMAAAAFAIGAGYFGSASAWPEWLSLAGSMEKGLPLSPEQGNESLALWLARHGGTYGALGYGALIGAALLLLLLLAFTSMGRRIDLLLPTAKRAFSSPGFAASVGVVLTFATSPLVWAHYFVLALVPIAWLVGRDGWRGAGTWGAVLCYAALARVTIDFLVATHTAWLHAITMLSWVALVPGLLAFAAEQRRSVEAAA